MRVRDLYPALWTAHGEAHEELDTSLNPRGPELLFEAAAALGLNAAEQVLDLGCGRGNHTSALIERFGCAVTGCDLVAEPLREMPPGKAALAVASAEAIPFRDGSFDFVWCRDMLVHVAELGTCLRESARVLRVGGRMLIATTQATDLLEPLERSRLCAALALIPENLDRWRFEDAVASSGLRIAARESVAGELMEFYEERDGRVSRELLRLARMSRNPERYGGGDFETPRQLYTWLVYHLLGKLSTVIYQLRKPEAPARPGGS